jgi:hypothetical protein
MNRVYRHRFTGLRLTAHGWRLTVHVLNAIQWNHDQGPRFNLNEGYFQSNHGRWCTSRWPTTYDQVAAARCGRQGSAMAGAAGAHRRSALHGYGALFSVVSLPTELVGCEELTKEVFYRRGALEQDVQRQGSSFNLRQWWGDAPRVTSWQGWAK